MDIQEKKIEFLYKAIEDAQQTTRFVDTKTSVTTFVIGLIAAVLSSGLSDFSDYFWNMAPGIQAIFITLILLISIFIALTIHSAIQVVFPKTNPSDHVDKTAAIANLFYLHEIKNKNGIDVISPSYDDYLVKFNKITNHAEIINELSFELQKTSYIRESKIRKVKQMKQYLRITLVLFPFILFMHYWGLSKYKTKDVTAQKMPVCVFKTNK